MAAPLQLQRPQALQCTRRARMLGCFVRAQAIAGQPRAGSPLNGLPLVDLPPIVVPAPQPVQVVNIPEPIPGVLAPPAAYQAIATAGGRKAVLPALNTFISGVLAGCYIAVAGAFTCAVQAGLSGLAPTVPAVIKLMGGMLFPVGLMLVILSGTELYTGNTAIMPMATYEKKADIGGLMHNWLWSYVGNFVGSLLVVAAVAASGVLDGNMVPVKVAELKASLPLAQAFTRSLLANWLVCMAVWCTTTATSAAGKMAVLWLPICTFVTLGFEHSVANMFFIPMGMALGAKVSISQFLLNNLLPVTIGNTLAGVLFVATAFSFLYGSLGKKPASAPAK